MTCRVWSVFFSLFTAEVVNFSAADEAETRILSWGISVFLRNGLLLPDAPYPFHVIFHKYLEAPLSLVKAKWKYLENLLTIKICSILFGFLYVNCAIAFSVFPMLDLSGRQFWGGYFFVGRVNFFFPLAQIPIFKKKRLERMLARLSRLCMPDSTRS